MSTLDKLFEGMVASSKAGDLKAVEGACQACLLLLHEDNNAPRVVSGAVASLGRVVPALDTSALGPAAQLLLQLSKRGNAPKELRRATEGLWERWQEQARADTSNRSFWHGLGGLLAAQPSLRASRTLPAQVPPSESDSQRLFYALCRAPRELRLRVLHPQAKRGYELRTRGILDLAQLQVLLSGVLVDSGDSNLLAGERASEAALRACGAGTLPLHPPTYRANWNLLRPDIMKTGADPEDMDLWLWPEACPSQLPTWAGWTTVLLAPPPYERTWPATRPYEELTAEAVLTRTLGAQEVEEILEDMARASG